MRNIIGSMLAVLSIGIMTAYFTSEPAKASQEMIQVDKGLFEELMKRSNEMEAASIKLFYRIERLEKKVKLEVPQELSITVNKATK